MNKTTIASKAKTASASVVPPARGLIQRKCACGNHTGGGGECDGCSKKRLNLQRRAVENRSEPSEVPPIVHDVLDSNGQPLDPTTRAFFEPRFGYDLSRVRVHTDSKAAETTEAVNALAFTVGQNIHFGAGEYHTDSQSGMRLLAHELAHTIQQRGVGTDIQRFSSDGSAIQDVRLEREAEHSAEEVVAGRFSGVVGASRMVTLQRQEKDKNDKSQALKIVPPVEPSKAQMKMINEARSAAAVRTQTAMFKARGIQGDSQLEEARRLARLKFDWADPNMDQIGEVISGMAGGLITVDVKASGPGDSNCGARSGYVRDHRPPIVLCPGFFSDPGDTEGRIRTMIHEMAHVKGVGKADAGEQYFPVFDCTSKGAFESADSWANYVHCLSGTIPDKPDEIVVPNKARRTQGK